MLYYHRHKIRISPLIGYIFSQRSFKSYSVCSYHYFFFIPLRFSRLVRSSRWFIFSNLKTLSIFKRKVKPSIINIKKLSLQWHWENTKQINLAFIPSHSAHRNETGMVFGYVKLQCTNLGQLNKYGLHSDSKNMW